MCLPLALFLYLGTNKHSGNNYSTKVGFSRFDIFDSSKVSKIANQKDINKSLKAFESIGWDISGINKNTKRAKVVKVK